MRIRSLKEVKKCAYNLTTEISNQISGVLKVCAFPYNLMGRFKKVTQARKREVTVLLFIGTSPVFVFYYAVLYIYKIIC